MAYPIGIDLGTTNSVACVWRRGRRETIPVDGRPTLPSVISVRTDGTVLIGHSAKNRAMLDPAASISSVKRMIGDGKSEWEVQGKTYTPVDVSRMVLARLKEAAEAFLGEPVRDAVITVPAYFNNNQKRDTKLAGEKAGFNVLQLLPEPTAAAISHGLDKGRDQTILVYDLGGGTFDVSVLKVDGNTFRALAVDGDFNLGGDDFDNLLVDHLIGCLQKKTQRDLGVLRSLFGSRKKTLGTERELLLARQLLKEAAEDAKIELSQCKETEVSIPEVLGTSLDEVITRDQYNKMIAPLVDRTIAKLRDVLKAAEHSADEIDRVILVGGSTRNTLVQERVASEVKEPWISDHVDEEVAQGAAIVAGYMTAPEEDLTPIEFSNVTPFSLGVRAAKGKDRDIFDVLIPKNTSLEDADVEKEFTTFRANQKSVDVSVFQGENANCKGNTFIGGFRLSGIPPAPAGEPKISVRFQMDSSDLLTVTAECSSLKSQQTLDVNLVSREDEAPDEMPRADILFLVDTSGSMSTELAGVKSSGLGFATRVIEAGVDCRLGLMDFDKGIGSDYKWEVFGPMAPPEFPSTVAGLRIGRLGGCGCYVGEMNTVPVMDAFVKAFPAEDRVKIGILVSDEVGNNAEAIRQIVNILQQGQVALHAVGVKGSCHEVLARDTGGRFWDIQASRGHVDFSSLLDSIAAEITNLALR